MNRRVYFADWHGDFWPRLEQLKPFFDNDGASWTTGGNDSYGLGLEGLEGTEDKPLGRGRKDIDLNLWGRPGLGVLIIYHKIGPVGFRDAWSSKGDMNRLREIVRTKHNDPMPVGLYIPFDKAWLAVKEFMETEGQLPKCIEWVRNADLPPNTFPDP